MFDIMNSLLFTMMCTLIQVLPCRRLIRNLCLASTFLVAVHASQPRVFRVSPRGRWSARPSIPAFELASAARFLPCTRKLSSAWPAGG